MGLHRRPDRGSGSPRELQTASPPPRQYSMGKSFAGTPSGLGWACKPQLLLHIDDELVTWADGIGEMRRHFAAPFIHP
jgi:hypothetical protein